MTEYEESNHCKFGTPLDPLDEEDLPRKKAVTLEDQYAVDERGRRRFHGAFTGGFSAGFWNTVGSMEGFEPATFKSSRSEKFERKLQKPEDFMDSEDREEWGIAPRRLQNTHDYGGKCETTNSKRKMHTETIPGEPVLQMFLTPPIDNVGIRLLKSMGWKQGQGVGPRTKGNSAKTYENELTETEDDVEMLGISFAPKDCDSYEATIKLDTFGIGYTGLDRRPVLQQFSLFDAPTGLHFTDKNKKVSIQGQAFGVGALEEDDHDIYNHEDMSQYDFSLATPEPTKTTKLPPKKTIYIQNSLEGFHISTTPQNFIKKYPLPNLPTNFKPVCGRISRFEPIAHDVESQMNDFRRKGLGRHDLNPDSRRDILNENSTSMKQDVIEENRSNIEQARNITAGLGDSLGSFRPFAGDPDKEQRYKFFISLSKDDRIKKLAEVQPLKMTEWEREKERRVFEQAERLYKPLQGVMSDRFVSSGQKTCTDEDEKILHGSVGERDAAKNKMFGRLTHSVEIWRPVSLLCKRFNVPEPIGGCAPNEDFDKKANFTVFDYLEPTYHTRENFNTIKNDANTPIKPTNNDSVTEIVDIKLQITSKEVPQTDSQLVVNDGQPSTSNSLKTGNVPSTDLTLVTKFSPLIKIKHNISENLVENKKLYKAIFANSDSEDEVNDKRNIVKIDLCEIPLVDNEPATMNIARNTSQPTGIFANIDLDALNTYRNADKNGFKVDENSKNPIKPVEQNNREPTVEAKTLVDTPKNPGKILFRPPNKEKAPDENIHSTIKFLNPNLDTIMETKPVLYFGPKLPDKLNEIDLVNKDTLIVSSNSDSNDSWIETNSVGSSTTTSSSRKKEKKHKVKSKKISKDKEKHKKSKHKKHRTKCKKSKR